MSDHDIPDRDTSTVVVVHCPRCGRAVLAPAEVGRVEVYEGVLLRVLFDTARVRHDCGTES